MKRIFFSSSQSPPPIKQEPCLYEESLVNVQRSPDGDLEKFICPLCGKTFIDINAHLKRDHKIIDFKDWKNADQSREQQPCSMCDQVFFVNDLIHHLKRVHEVSLDLNYAMNEAHDSRQDEENWTKWKNWTEKNQWQDQYQQPKPPLTPDVLWSRDNFEKMKDLYPDLSAIEIYDKCKEKYSCLANTEV